MTVEIQWGDSLNVLSLNNDLPSPSSPIQTWILDPPYNIGFNYGPNFNDDLPDAAYHRWLNDLACVMLDNTVRGGSLFFIHYPTECARILPHLERAGWRLHQWISWVYPANFGHSNKRFTKAHRSILWLSHGEPTFYPEATVQPYKNPNDKRIRKLIESGRTGTTHYDWWEINLCKNVSRDYLGYHNQIPEELLKRCILATTKEGQMVGDPCAGSGSTMRAAIMLNRRGWGCDINQEAYEMWLKSEWIQERKVFDNGEC